jgi:hypothetical protein
MNRARSAQRTCRSAWRTPLENVELMPQDQDFDFQPPSWLEVVAQHADEEEDYRDHRPQSYSNSVAGSHHGGWSFRKRQVEK